MTTRPMRQDCADAPGEITRGDGLPPGDADARAPTRSVAWAPDDDRRPGRPQPGEADDGERRGERDWVHDLTSGGVRQHAALGDLHSLMLRASRHQVWRMRSQLGDVGPGAVDVLVNQCADEAMATLLRKLDTFAGRSRFTTWAYKFAIVQTATEVRRTAWRLRDVPLEDIGELRDRGESPIQSAEALDLARAMADVMHRVLTPHQRRITIALAVDLVPADVLAERLGTTRGALYKTLHDARTRVRAELVRTGYLPDPPPPRVQEVP